MKILPAYFNERIRPEGIEPPSQEPESYVISITLRTEFLFDNYYSLTNFPLKGKETSPKWKSFFVLIVGSKLQLFSEIFRIILWL